MKLPDLAVYDEAGVRDWHGDFDTVKTAAAAAKLLFHSVDAAHADSKSALLAALAKGLKLPEHFGNNWDALADCLEDGDWLGSHGMVIAIRHAANYRKAHAADWETLSDILSEAAEYWRERHKPFWVFIH
jgi:RNAse (barnase) inhibitor barstar